MDRKNQFHAVVGDEIEPYFAMRRLHQIVCPRDFGFDCARRSYSPVESVRLISM